MTSMNTVSEKLRFARESQGLTLDDISNATRIQTNLLRAIDEGNFSILPPAYIRAFLRSYARQVGLDETDVLAEYDAVIAQDSKPPTDHSKEASRTPSRPANDKRVRQKNVLAVITFALVVALVGSLVFLRSGGNGEDVDEIPFQEVVRQQDTSPVKKTSPGPASTASPQEGGAPHDSLLLRVMTFDSVWIRIVIDDTLKREYLAPPRWSAKWKAREKFVVSVGNASALSFTLNNVALGSLGAPGKPVKNFLVTAANLTASEVKEARRNE